MKRQWALVAIGAWLAGTVCMSIVATENFYTIDRLLTDSQNAAFTSAVQRLGQPLARDVLRYLSSELNRLYFQMWNIAQVVLGITALWLIAAAGKDERGALRPATRGVIVMLCIVVVMLGYLTPSIVSLGRSLDFVPEIPRRPA